MSTTAAPNVSNANSGLVEGEDYYWEGAVIVFTAHYLLGRGYCCDSGCRHCPYRKVTAADPSLVKPE